MKLGVGIKSIIKIYINDDGKDGYGGELGSPNVIMVGGVSGWAFH